MSRNVISANPEHYLFKIFQESMPPDPLEGLKIFFPVTARLQKFFRIDFPPKQKILDRTLICLTSSQMCTYICKDLVTGYFLYLVKKLDSQPLSFFKLTLFFFFFNIYSQITIYRMLSNTIDSKYVATIQFCLYTKN